MRFAAVALALLALVAGPAFAQSAAAADPMAKRVLACTTCHGKEGRATSEGYFPRIAGKPAGYLFNQLVNFREGRRIYAPMTYLIDHLSDAYLLEIAQHFASLELPYPPPQTKGASPDTLARGKALVFDGARDRDIPACAQCHGKTLTGVKPAVPGLLGLPRDYLNGQLGAWQTRQRHATAPDCMATIAGKLTTQETDAVSTWLSSQPVPADSRPASAHAGPLPMTCGSIPR